MRARARPRRPRPADDRGQAEEREASTAPKRSAETAVRRRRCARPGARRARACGTGGRRPPRRPGDDAAERVPGQLRRGDREPALRLKRDPLQLPHGDEGERLDAERYHHPLRFELRERPPLVEDLADARPEEVQGDERDDEEEAAPGDPPHAPPTLRHRPVPLTRERPWRRRMRGRGAAKLSSTIFTAGHRQGEERPDDLRRPRRRRGRRRRTGGAGRSPSGRPSA